MRRRLHGFLTLLVVLLTGASGADGGTLYLLSGSTDLSDGRSSFGSIDTATGVYTEIVADFLPPHHGVRNLAWNAALGQFYVTVNFYNLTTLHTLDTQGQISSSLGTIGHDITGMTYSEADGTLYAYNPVLTPNYGTIDPVTGTWSVLTSGAGLAMPIPQGGRLALHAGTVYAVGATDDYNSGRFGSFGTTAGSTFAQVGAADSRFQHMVLASDGTRLYGLYANGAGTQQLYTIDLVTGALSEGPSLTGTGLGQYFYGAGVARTSAVPEPSTLLGASLGGLTACLIACRRRSGTARS